MRYYEKPEVTVTMFVAKEDTTLVEESGGTNNIFPY